jgi:hypothetical protein
MEKGVWGDSPPSPLFLAEEEAKQRLIMVFTPSPGKEKRRVRLPFRHKEKVKT